MSVRLSAATVGGGTPQTTRWRFSLASLLTAILVVAVACAVWVRQEQRQRRELESQVVDAGPASDVLLSLVRQPAAHRSGLMAMLFPVGRAANPYFRLAFKADVPAGDGAGARVCVLEGSRIHPQDYPLAKRAVIVLTDPRGRLLDWQVVYSGDDREWLFALEPVRLEPLDGGGAALVVDSLIDDLSFSAQRRTRRFDLTGGRISLRSEVEAPLSDADRERLYEYFGVRRSATNGPPLAAPVEGSESDLR